MSDTRISTMKLVLVPGLITLGVTVLRLVGELRHWSSFWFNPAPGGGGAIFGIVWLPLIFGPYFALKLAGTGEAPASLGKAFGFTGLALVVTVGAIAVFMKAGFKSGALGLVGIVLTLASMLIPLLGWPALTKTLLAYGYAARIPVAIIMFFALKGNWGTHYDGLPPTYPADVGFTRKYIQVALVPQLTGWIAWTVIVGSLFGAIAYAVAGKKPALTVNPEESA